MQPSLYRLACDTCYHTRPCPDYSARLAGDKPMRFVLNSRKSLNQLKQLASELPASIAKAHAVYQTLERTLASLEHQGLIHEKGYWRNHKYFCLYSSSRQGERRVFRYVGCNPEKIRAIQAAMRRAIEYDEVIAQLACLEGFAEQCCCNLAEILRTLRAFETIGVNANRQ